MSGDGGSTTDARVEAIAAVLLALARQDFTARAPISDTKDGIDALAAGINMLAEALSGAVVSRQQLELAYTSLRATQTALVHAGKLAAIGQLASGVAHEVNNPASWSSLALELARKRVAELEASLASGPVEPTVARGVLEEVDDHLERASEGLSRILFVVGDLRTFARTETDTLHLMILDEVVQTTRHLVEPSVKDQVRIVCELGAVPPMRGNTARLGQVVTNLLVNAARAATRDDGQLGTVAIRTSQDGAHVLLVVEDDGPGVPDELRDRVFDPFFTTDPQGMGLGLSLVAKIVDQHGGDVRVERSSLGGARFVVRFPAAAGPL